MTLLLLLTNAAGVVTPPSDEEEPFTDRWLPDATISTGTAFATVGIVRPHGRFEQ